MACRGRSAGAEALAAPPPATVEANTAGGSPSAVPTPIRIIAHHGFIDGHGVHRLWTPGQVVADPHTVALLVARGARHEPE